MNSLLLLFLLRPEVSGHSSTSGHYAMRYCGVSTALDYCGPFPTYTQIFPPGWTCQQIMAVQPLSAVLEEGQARTRCANCFEHVNGQDSSGGGSRCSGCKSIWYCSRTCQKADWREHRAECKAWTSNQTTGVRGPQSIPQLVLGVGEIFWRGSRAIQPRMKS